MLKAIHTVTNLVTLFQFTAKSLDISSQVDTIYRTLYFVENIGYIE